MSGIADLPWLCIGDFNELLETSNKEGGLDRPHGLLENFRNTLDDYDLEDMGFLGPRFTWSNKRGGNSHVQEHIDKGVCCFRWKQLFPFSIEIKLPNICILL